MKKITIPLIIAVLAVLSGCAGTGGKQSIAERSKKTKAAMSTYTTKVAPVGADTVLVSDSEATGKQLNGTDDITLTSYVWEYLGNPIPSDIYGAPGSFTTISIGTTAISDGTTLIQ